ncbi:MAG TPA: helix-turn-helix domain-containing protein [bacterium]|nr:helix-turn-helix domain-containing protein [bacterium]
MSNDPKNQRRWMTVKEIAEYLGLTTKAIYNRVHMRRIPYSKLGGSLRFDKEAIDNWLSKNTVLPE